MANNPNTDRIGATPVYLKLANILKDQIAGGTYLPGDRLPSESELCKQHQVSPMTVRRSINILIDQRIVSTIQGSGTYVRGPDLGGVTFNMEEFKTIFMDRERTKVKILEVLIIKADKTAAKKLEINIGEKTILISRVLIRDGDPIVYHKEQLIYDPARPVVEAEMEVTTLHGLFVGTGETKIKMGRLSIEAAVLSKEEADVLSTVQMNPAFRIEHLFYDLKNKPVSWGKFICRGDRLRFTTIVGISDLNQFPTSSV
jgi:DNA-binding GntR family transcriptional regulator